MSVTCCTPGTRSRVIWTRDSTKKRRSQTDPSYASSHASVPSALPMLPVTPPLRTPWSISRAGTSWNLGIDQRSSRPWSAFATRTPTTASLRKASSTRSSSRRSWKTTCATFSRTPALQVQETQALQRGGLRRLPQRLCKRWARMMKLFPIFVLALSVRVTSLLRMLSSSISRIW